MKKNNLIIISTLLFFLVCGFFLVYTQTKQMNLANAKTWWTAYFQDPKSEDLSFDIENHSSSNSFHWEADSGNNILSQGNETIPNNQTKKIPLSNLDSQNQKIIIMISNGKDKKEIYKNF
jgi:hypothetical protein